MIHVKDGSYELIVGLVSSTSGGLGMPLEGLSCHSKHIIAKKNVIWKRGLRNRHLFKSRRIETTN